MKHSTDRILTTHAGSLPRPADLKELVNAKSAGQAVDEAALGRRIREAVERGVRKQVETGVDIVNDGELSKPNFTEYVRERIGGYRGARVARRRPPHSISGRDRRVPRILRDAAAAARRRAERARWSAWGRYNTSARRRSRPTSPTSRRR